MQKGQNIYIESFLRFIREDDKVNMEYFYLESLTRQYQKIDNTSEIESLLTPEELSQEESDALLNYSGFNYKHINALLRGTWNYEENGDISKAESHQISATYLKELISKRPTILNDNIIVYRGVDISYFKEYGIESIQDLKSLENNYMLDRGFVSTSIQEDTCFYKKDNCLGLNYNIKIEYMVPQEFKDGILLGKSTSYSPNQQEFLINSANLAKVSNVTVNDDNTAVVRTMLIPKELYDNYYRNKSNKTEQK